MAPRTLRDLLQHHLRQPAPLPRGELVMSADVLLAIARWSASTKMAGVTGKWRPMEDGAVYTYRTEPEGSPVAGRVACVFISADGLAMTLSDGSNRHEVEAITDTHAGRLEAAHQIREWVWVTTTQGDRR